MEAKFLVLKYGDIDKVLEKRPYISQYIADLYNEVTEIRLRENRVPDPTYLVINTDESYAPEVIEILKRNGHWG